MLMVGRERRIEWRQGGERLWVVNVGGITTIVNTISEAISILCEYQKSNLLTCFRPSDVFLHNCIYIAVDGEGKAVDVEVVRLVGLKGTTIDVTRSAFNAEEDERGYAARDNCIVMQRRN